MKLYLSLIAPVTLIFGADPYAEQLFQKNCAACHQAATGAEARVPQMAALKTMTPVAILRTLESGIMKAQAAPLSGDERQTWWDRAVAAYPPYAEYQQKTDRVIPVFLATRRTGR